MTPSDPGSASQPRPSVVPHGGADAAATTAAQTPFAPVDEESSPAKVEAPRYEQLELLGEGGMGEVRLYRDTLIGREVAVKALKPAHGARSDSRVRFLREARVQGRLEHPAIVPVYDLSVRPEPAFFTMKRVRGQTLASILAKLATGDPSAAATYSRHKLLSAFNSVCLAVDFAHAHGVVHRDLKPDNIMLGDFGEVYVLDWGVASVSDEALPTAAEAIEAPAAAGTEAGAVIGTPGYMSPEQAGGARVDLLSDIYSLGATLFEILALVPLHRGATRSELLTSVSNRADVGLSLRAADKELPPELEAICVKATELQPPSRYRSARELHDAVERFLDGVRDLGLRRSLADRHAVAAALAKQRAVQSVGPARDAALRDALGEVGHALALDPTNEGALRVTLDLRRIAPRTLPAEARAELEAARERTFAESSRDGAISFATALLYLPVGLWMGVRDVRPLAVLYVLLFAAAALSYVAVRRKSRPLTYAVAVCAAGAFGAMSRVLGPFVLVPSALVTCGGSFAMDPDRRRRWFALACCCLAVVTPWALEQAGILEASYVFGQGTITIVPHEFSLPETPTLALLLSVSIGTILTLGVLVGRTRNALEWAEHRIHLYSWQLRQLVPRAAHGAADPGFPARSLGTSPSLEDVGSSPRSTR